VAGKAGHLLPPSVVVHAEANYVFCTLQCTAIDLQPARLHGELLMLGFEAILEDVSSEPR
jgi:hypothetical protein